MLAAQEMYRKEMGALGLQLSAGESEIYIPEWREVETDLLAGMPAFSRSRLEGQTAEFMTMASGDTPCKGMYQDLRMPTGNKHILPESGRTDSSLNTRRPCPSQ